MTSQSSCQKVANLFRQVGQLFPMMNKVDKVHSWMIIQQSDPKFWLWESDLLNFTQILTRGPADPTGPMSPFSPSPGGPGNETPGLPLTPISPYNVKFKLIWWTISISFHFYNCQPCLLFHPFRHHEEWFLSLSHPLPSDHSLYLENLLDLGRLFHRFCRLQRTLLAERFARFNFPFNKLLKS